jgi:hypothetical protein
VDEIFARRDVIETATLRRLCVPSDARGIAQTASHLGAIVGTGTLLWFALGTWWTVPMLPPDYPVMGRSAALLRIQDGKKRGVRAIDDLRELLVQQG